MTHTPTQLAAATVGGLGAVHEKCELPRRVARVLLVEDFELRVANSNMRPVAQGEERAAV